MKCIRIKKNGAIKRVSDAEAAALVTTGVAEYCPKSDWKRQKLSESA